MSDSWDGKHILKIRDDREYRILEATKDGEMEYFNTPETPDKKFTPSDLRKDIEPWLTALFQSEHLTLLTGAGLPSAVHQLATGSPGAGMSKATFSVFNKQIDAASEESATKSGRGKPNIEDQIRTANRLIQGLQIFTSDKVAGADKINKDIKIIIDELIFELKSLTNAILKSENNIVQHGITSSAVENLMNFLVSFASRSATRERLNIFTTNYDRIIEFGAELAGIRLLDRFIGSIYPIFRSSRLEVDMHYNPPGIRGEPRYLEGVAHFTKLHGSLDWIYQDGYVRRIALPFGAESIETFLPTCGTEKADARSLMIYPNEAKDRETAEYPYIDLFRDFASAVCCPNSTLVIYGYSFGDEHINRIIKDMLTIPSTHLVIIAYSDDGGRIQSFCRALLHSAQMSLLIGNHFGNLKTLVDYYLPKPAIDRTTFRMAELLKARGIVVHEPSDKKDGSEKEVPDAPKSS